MPIISQYSSESRVLQKSGDDDVFQENDYAIYRPSGYFWLRKIETTKIWIGVTMTSTYYLAPTMRYEFSLGSKTLHSLESNVDTSKDAYR